MPTGTDEWTITYIKRGDDLFVESPRWMKKQNITAKSIAVYLARHKFKQYGSDIIDGDVVKRVYKRHFVDTKLDKDLTA